MAYELPSLGYAYDALEPHIDARTMEIHHTKHHQTYITNANGVLENHPDLAAKSVNKLISDLDSIPEAARTALRNNAGGHSNHSFFWKIIAPGGSDSPTGGLAAAIDAELGGLDSLKEAFGKAGATRFGSGWAWLSVSGGNLAVHSTANQDSPIMEGSSPVIGLDVWEHAYYLNYQNRRPDYIAAFWNVVNWTQAEENYQSATS
ncbi:MAG: superoxide dismutase [Mn] [Opitutaceae bacterium]|nr:superoxide dismutase [Mn] [Opitutaceae bacterium]|tara:strand:+ start:1167 stop:1778 length:612 start_codon:yes stop_codon:yes gene_type:complete